MPQAEQPPSVLSSDAPPTNIKPSWRLPSPTRSCPAPEGFAMSDSTSPDLAETINALLDRRDLRRQR
jgi:hypothetical protein